MKTCAGTGRFGRIRTRVCRSRSIGLAVSVHLEVDWMNRRSGERPEVQTEHRHGEQVGAADTAVGVSCLGGNCQHVGRVCLSPEELMET